MYLFSLQNDYILLATAVTTLLYHNTAVSLTEEVQKLRQQNKEQAKEITRLKEENEFLAEASAFFAASRRKSAKT